MGSDDDNDDDERGENREERGEGKRKVLVFHSHGIVCHFPLL